MWKYNKTIKKIAKEIYNEDANDIPEYFLARDKNDANIFVDFLESVDFVEVSMFKKYNNLDLTLNVFNDYKDEHGMSIRDYLTKLTIAGFSA